MGVREGHHSKSLNHTKPTITILPTSAKQEPQGRDDRHLLVGHLGRQDLPVLAIKRLYNSMPK